jgi:AraC-like DNA-binding protein
MRNEIYTEISHKLIFTLFDSIKQQKSNMFRVHHHAELELGFMCEGEGLYILESENYEIHPGDLFLVRTNEQHCVPTIYTSELASYNIHINSYYLWSVCSEYIEPAKLRVLIGGNTPIKHRYFGREETFLKLKKLSEDALRNRFEIRRLVLELIQGIANEIDLPENFIDRNENSEDRIALLHLNDIQNAILFINENLTEPITLDDIARSANLSRSHLSTLFKHMTGITPYEYLILQRVEKAVVLLRETDTTILCAAQECGFNNLANFNKTFKKVTGMTPSDYRNSKRMK